MHTLLSTMLNATVDARWPAYLLLAAFIGIMIAVAFVSYKKANTLQGFMLGNRSIGSWMSAFGYGTTYFSAVVFIGYAGKYGMSMGLGAIWIGVANAIIGSLFAWLVLAKRTRNMTQELKANTMPEFFEARYNSKHIKLLTALIIFVLLIPYSASVYQGIAYLAENIFGMKYEYCILIMAVLVGVYLFIGGYFANAISSFIQGIIMLVGVVAMLIYIINSDAVRGIEGFRTLLAPGSGYGFFPTLVAEEGKGWLTAPGAQLIINILLTSFAVWALPQSVSKFYAIKDNSAIKKGVIISTVFALVVGGGAYLNGSMSSLFVDGSVATDRIIPTMLISSGMGYFMLGVIFILVLSASMSTLSALAMSAATTISIDLYKGYIKKDASDKNSKILMRALCFVFIAVSAVLALYQWTFIVNLMSLSWGTLAGCFIGPYIYGLYMKKANKFGAYASVISSIIIVAVIVGVLGMDFAAFSGIVAMAWSMIVTPIASIVADKILAIYATKKASKEDSAVQEAELVEDASGKTLAE